MKKVKHYLTIAGLSKDNNEWKLIKVKYEHDFLEPSLWLENCWEDYCKYERIVIVDDIAMEVVKKC